MPEVRLKLRDDTVYENPGYSETISGIIDTNTGSVSLRAVFPHKEKILMSGGTGKIIIPQTIDNCIVIPKSATFELQDKVFAYKIEDGKTKSTEIKVNPSNDGKTYIVESGLMQGDKIISEGVALLRNGVPVSEKK